MARMLVVDDDPISREVLRAILEGAGHAVSDAADGETALDLAAREAPDLAFVDLFMPGCSGSETIARLRRLQPGLPVVAMTGGGAAGDQGCVLAAADQGAALTLLKPFEFAAVLAAVRALLPHGGTTQGAQA